jgi:diguanylate cyclase (GGDEF)-like protein
MTFDSILFRRRDDESLRTERNDTDRRLRAERNRKDRVILDSCRSTRERENMLQALAEERQATDEALAAERARADKILLQERRLSRTDVLTDLPNTRLFMESLGTAAHRCRLEGRPLALIYLDIDNFKTVNDRFGHPAGDRLLQRVSKILGATVRHEDIAARLGGDEFALLLCGLSHEEAENIGNRVLERVRELSAHYAGVSLSVSAGLVYFEGPPPSGEEILRNADRTMYQAKAAGKNLCLKKILPHFPLRRPIEAARPRDPVQGGRDAKKRRKQQGHPSR